MIVYEVKAVDKETGNIMFQGEIIGAEGIKDIAKMYMRTCELYFRVKKNGK